MKNYDVIVCGGGTAGVIAATAAAREGAHTLLIERDGYLGGTATYGLPFLGFFSGNGTKVVGGLAQELVDRMIANGGCMGHMRGGKWRKKIGKKDYEFSLTPFDPECLKFTAQQMVIESKVDLMLQSILTDAHVSEGHINSIEVMTVEGKKKVTANYFIDTTGDALITWMASFPTLIRKRGNLQNVTNVIRIGNVDPELMLEGLKKGQGIKGLEDWHIRIVKGKLLDGNNGIVHLAGHIDIRGNKSPLTFTAVRWRMEEMSFNITRTINIVPTNAADINKAEINERNNINDIVKALRKSVPGFEKAYLLSSSPRVGIRESRRICGLYTLNEEEVLSGKDFPDGIARGAYPIDIHDPKGGKTQFSFIKDGGSYSIPYRCLIPKGSKNLIVAGRCVSATGKALGSVRLMPCCMALGQAAGTAAALSGNENIQPAELSSEKLRKKLIENKAILNI